MVRCRRGWGIPFYPTRPPPPSSPLSSRSSRRRRPTAKSFTLPDARLSVDVRPNGALVVDEHLTFFFNGSFTGAFREIPLREGESIDQVFVAEGGRRYAPGASAELGSSGAPGTFGVARTEDGIRIVWHYDASFQQRTFTVHYRLSGLAVAYDDVVDVNLRVWGDEWEVGLDRLEATLTTPNGEPVRRVWGHPVSVRGDVQITPDGALLRALDIPPRQWVEMRSLIPRSAFTSTAGMRVVDGPGLAQIVGEEVAAAEAYERDREKIDDALAHPFRTLLIVLALGFLPATAILWYVWRRFGREVTTGTTASTNRTRPATCPPALVPPLVAQRGGVGSNEFTATLFDLIRRGVFHAEPVTTEKSMWAGLRSEQIADLEITPGTRDSLTPWEDAVADVVDHVLDGGSKPLSEFRDEIEEERPSQSKRFVRFKEKVASEIDDRGWYRDIGLAAVLAAAAAFAGLGALLAFIASREWSSVAPTWRSVVLIGSGRQRVPQRGRDRRRAVQRALLAAAQPGGAGGG